jgi:uncharacterized protein YdaU (DUF1376 family)
MTNTAPQKDFKPTFIPWYETDFRADRIVQRMTPVQRSFYRNLLLDCYFGEHRPYISANDSELWLIAEANTLEEWLAAKTLILTKFTAVELKDGTRALSNKRVLEEWARLEHLLKQKQNAGLASAMARRAKAKNPPAPPKSRKDKKRVEHTTTDKSVAQTLNERSTAVQNVDIVDDSSSSLGQKRDKTDAEIIAEFRRVWESTRANTGAFQTTKEHRPVAAEFYKRVGRDVALAAWENWLLTENHLSQRNGKVEPRSWLLHDFITSGDAEIYAERARPLAALGAKGWVLTFLAAMDREEIAEANLTPEDLNTLEQMGKEQVEARWADGLREMLSPVNASTAIN